MDRILPNATNRVAIMSVLERRLPTLCLLATSETSPQILYGLLEVFRSVGVMYPELTTGTPGTPMFDVKVVAAGREPFRCFANALVEPDHDVEDIASAEIVIVCDMNQPIDRPPHGLYRRETAWLRKMYAGGAILSSVCSGSLVLAESGLLDGFEAASHWCYVPLFRDHYPKVHLRQDLVLCRSGDDERIITAGAVTAWQDLALYLIARCCGPKFALQTAKLFLFSERAHGQLPYAVTTPMLQARDAIVRDCQIWIAENYASANPVRRMAARATLSPRGFARRFRAATGLLPMEYVHAIRIEEAKQLLEIGSLTVEEVGSAVGYQDPASFGRLFKRRAGLTPTAYRRKFAALGKHGPNSGKP